MDGSTIAVVPKSDCSHVKDHYDSSITPDVKSACTTCEDKSENWICLKCGEVNCSRYVKGDAAKHSDKTGHGIAASFTDFSVWCYLCDSYIKDDILSPFLQKLHHSKFGTTPNSNKEDKDKKPDKTSKGKNKKGNKSDSRLLKQMMGLSIKSEEETCFLKDLTLEGVAKAISEGKCKNVIVMSGAGISVAAGIPDFRTPGTGLYDNLEKYDLPYPTAVFELSYFRNKPQPFFTLAKELYPGNYKPTTTHYFVRLLHEEGILLRNFTQNIDNLERLAGVPSEKLVEAHGSFASASCISCHKTADTEFVKECVFSDQIPKCKECDGLVKPDIVFFGESLPSRFHELLREDFPKCDLLIVIGTSLQVQPFASLIHKVSPSTPRLLINREPVAMINPDTTVLTKGFRFGHSSNYRDIGYIGDCQDGVRQLVQLLGWEVATTTRCTRLTSFKRKN